MPPVSLIAGIHGIHRSERDLPLDLGSGGSESLSVSLTLADGLKVAYLPSDISLSNAAGTASQAWAAEEETLRLDAKFDFPNRIVAAKDYPNLKALHGAMTSEAARTIIFK